MHVKPFSGLRAMQAVLVTFVKRIPGCMKNCFCEENLRGPRVSSASHADEAVLLLLLYFSKFP